MARSSILGLECRLYVNTAARADTTVRGNPAVWTSWDCVEDSTMSIQFDTVQSTCRGAAGWKQSSATLGSLELTGNVIVTPSDPVYQLMAAAASARTVLDIASVDGERTAVAGDSVSGYRADMVFSQWSRSEPIADVVKVAFTLVVARTSFAPEIINAPF